MKNSLSRLRDLDKMCRMLMKDIGEAYAIPGDLKGKQLLLRGLMNMRYPITMNPDFLELQDKELQLQRQEKGEVSVDSLVKDSKLSSLNSTSGKVTSPAYKLMSLSMLPTVRCSDVFSHFTPVSIMSYILLLVFNFVMLVIN